MTESIFDRDIHLKTRSSELYDEVNTDKIIIDTRQSEGSIVIFDGFLN